MKDNRIFNRKNMSGSQRIDEYDRKGNQQLQVEETQVRQVVDEFSQCNC